MTTPFSIDPNETLQNFDIREQLAHREIFKDLLNRSKSGELLEFPKIVETYPQLREYRSYVLDLVYEDYCQRAAAGEIRRTAEYAGVFPEYDTQIQELIEVHRYFHASGNVPEWLSEQKVWPLPGEDFLGYEICSELGRGAIGRVYLAREQSLGNRLVALKISPYGQAEATLLAKLNHPHVVPIYSVCEDPASNLTAVCMPFKGRSTLADLMLASEASPPWEKSRRFWQELKKRSSVDEAQSIDTPNEVLNRPFPETTLELISQAARALVYVHGQNILHRDLKPSNILITPERVAMLLDFNLSIDLMGVENRIGGTLPYMSPEQVEQVLISPKGKNTLDERTDLYALGVICYELLSGKLPFPAKAAGVVTKAEAIDYVKKIQAGAEPIQRLVPELDDRTAALVHRCLEFDRTVRPRSASDLLAELDHCRGRKAQLRRSILRHPRRAALGMTLLSILLILASVMFLTQAPFAERKIELGRKQTAAKDYETAAASFREALTVEPQNIAALNGLGRAQALAKDWAGAKASWSKSYEIQQDPKIAACLGYLESQAGNYKSAIQWYELAESMLPNSAEFASNLAHTYRLLGTATQALAFEQFDAAIALQPKLRQALSGRAKLAYMADINDHRPLRRSAIDDVDQAIALPEPYPELLVLGSVCHLAVGDPAHGEIAKQLSLRALQGGMSFEEFENLQRDQALLVDPEIAKYRSKRPAAARLSQESPWIDLWPGLFLLP